MRKLTLRTRILGLVALEFLSLITCEASVFELGGWPHINKHRKAEIASGELKVLLMKVTAKSIDKNGTIEDAPPSANPNTPPFFLPVSVYTLEQGGKDLEVELYILSKESAKNGWFVLLSKWDELFINFSPAKSSFDEQNQAAQLWDFPPEYKLRSKEGESLIYVGQIEFTLFKWKSLFGWQIHYPGVYSEFPAQWYRKNVDPDTLAMLKESFQSTESLSEGDVQTALSLLEEHFPNAGEPVVRLLEEYDETGPLVFDGPLP